jgi:hypothetical protein
MPGVHVLILKMFAPPPKKKKIGKNWQSEILPFLTTASLPAGVGPPDPEVWRAAAGGHVFHVIDGDLVVPLGVERRVQDVADEQVGACAEKSS